MDLMSHALDIASNIIAKQTPQVTVEKKEDTVFETRSLTITEDVMLLDKPETDHLPWTSFDLTNNGPNPVYFAVNEWNWMEASLPVGQTINVDLKYKNAIKKVYLKCDAGETANIRLYILK